MMRDNYLKSHSRFSSSVHKKSYFYYRIMCNKLGTSLKTTIQFRARGIGVCGLRIECSFGTLTKSQVPDECYGNYSRCHVLDQSISRVPQTTFYSGPGLFSSNARTQRARRPLRFHRRQTLAGLCSATLSPLIDKTLIIFWKSIQTYRVFFKTNSLMLMRSSLSTYAVMPPTTVAYFCVVSEFQTSKIKSYKRNCSKMNIFCVLKIYILNDN